MGKKMVAKMAETPLTIGAEVSKTSLPKKKKPLHTCWRCDQGIFEEDKWHDVPMASEGETVVLCDDCMDYVVECDDCGEYADINEVTEVFGGDKVCSGCLDDYNKCQDCWIYASDNNFITDSGTNVAVCEKCYENNYFTCQDCEYVYHVDDHAEDSHCSECWSENHSCDEDEGEEYCQEEQGDQGAEVLFTAKSAGTWGGGNFSTPVINRQGTALVHFECAVKTFYLLYALEERLSRKRSELLYSVKREMTAYSSKFARALFDYMAIASIGEARHAQWNPADKMIKGFYSHELRTNRTLVYSQLAHTVDPIASAPALIEVFGSKWKEQGYGGPKWESIVRGYATYPDRISDVLFIDMVINKRHNGSLAFDKGVIFKMPDGQSRVLSFLDYRREKDLLEFAYNQIYPITPELFTLLEAAERERIIKRFPRDIRIVEIRWSPPVRWGSIVLEACDNVRPVKAVSEGDGDEKCLDCGFKLSNCECECTEEADNTEQIEGESVNEQASEEISQEEYYGDIYSKYRETISGLADVAGRNHAA